MTKQDSISIFITFLMGLFAGAYLYLVGFAVTFEPPEAAPESTYKEFVISGESFGECDVDSSCLSFQLLENGAYRAILGSESTVKEGVIPRSLRLELKKVLTREILALESEVTHISHCHYGFDGTNYTFKITRDQVDYEIDTCLSDIDYQGKVWLLLAKLWNHFATVDF